MFSKKKVNIAANREKAASSVTDRKESLKPEAGVSMEQMRAIQHKDGPMMVLAGPGSGKTFVITRRLKCMIEAYGIPPEEILVVTFSRAAAAEMQERFFKLMGDANCGVMFGTFHAVYFHILKNTYRYDTSCIVTEKEKRRYLKEAFSAHPEVAEDEQTYAYVLASISKIKNEGIAPQDFRDDCCLLEKEVFLEIFREYQKIMKAEGKLDFDDMVLLCRDLFVKHPEILTTWRQRYHYILIDEFQDINPMQYEVIKMLAAPDNNLFIVGDDDQAIYGFRGSSPGIMLEFPKEYPEQEQVILKANYRSTQGIVDKALQLVGHNKSRYTKRLQAQRVGKNDVTTAGFDNREEEVAAVIKVIQSAVQYMPYKELALLFRTNASARFYSQKLCAAGIPFYIKEKISSVFYSPIGMDIMAVFAYAQGEQERRHLLRFFNKPPRYIRRGLLEEENCDLKAMLYRQDVPMNIKKNIRTLLHDLELLKEMHPFAGVNFIRKGMGYESWLIKEARAKGRDTGEIMETLDLIADSTRQAKDYRDWLEQIESYEKALEQSTQERGQDAVQLLTMHSAKGLEYTTVILPDVNEGNVPQKKADKIEDPEEERRVFYVAMTRAREKLFLFYLKKNTEKKVFPSRFLKEMGIKGE